jgi:hypothetical protein
VSVSQDGLVFDMFVSPHDACTCVCSSNHRGRMVCMVTPALDRYFGWWVCRPCREQLVAR